MTRRTRTIPHLFAACALIVLVGCDTKVEQPDSGPNSSHRTERVDPGFGAGSGSTLGKARDRAKDVESQVDDYNRRIEEAAEKVDGK